MDELPLSQEHRSALDELREEFSQFTDFRQPGKVQHPYEEALLSGLCAMVCGCESFTAMAEFAKYRLEWLREWLPLENGSPSHDTFRNVFMMGRPSNQRSRSLASPCAEA